jgi:hypothetical protein
MDSADDRFASLRKAGLPGQLCLTWCQGDELEEVARAFGADMETGRWADPDDIEDLEDEHPGELLQLVPMDGWVIALEPDGFQGAREEVLASLSRDGRALSVHWNVELDSAVTYAVNGEILTAFDLINIERRTGSAPEALNEILLEVGLHDGLSMQDRKARTLVLGEKISGRSLTTDWLQSPQFVFTIKDPLPDQLIPTACLHPQAPFLDEPDFVQLLTAPSPSTAPAIVRMVTIAALSVAALDDPLQDDVMRLLNHGEQHTGQRDSLRLRLTERVAETRRRAKRLRSGPSPVQAEEAGRLESAADATFVLAEALHTSPMAAATAATALAINLSLPRADHLRMRVLHNLVQRIEYDLRHF